MRRLGWALLLAVAGCSNQAYVPAATGPAQRVCRAGPDGSRPIADRGIGGTGAPLVAVADRGIGGTGIIGVITGFASICVAGKEVALPPDAAARIDETAARLDDLRTGQVVAIEAQGQPGELAARRIAVRHTVIGPVESVGPGTMTVAGQMVAIEGAAGAATEAKPGQWVAVSGLRLDSAIITATRIDPAEAGRVLVRGELVRIYGDARVGSLSIVLPPGSNLPAGWTVTVSGQLRAGVLIADSASRDLAAESPSAYFGPAVNSFIVESYVAVLAGGYLVDREFVPGTGFGRVGMHERGIASFSRGPGGLVADGLQFGGGKAGGGSLGFTPAPAFPAGGGQGAAPGDRSRVGGFLRGGVGATGYGPPAGSFSSGPALGGPAGPSAAGGPSRR